MIKLPRYKEWIILNWDNFASAVENFVPVPVVRTHLCRFPLVDESAGNIMFYVCWNIQTNRALCNLWTWFLIHSWLVVHQLFIVNFYRDHTSNDASQTFGSNNGCEMVWLQWENVTRSESCRYRRRVDTGRRCGVSYDCYNVDIRHYVNQFQCIVTRSLVYGACYLYFAHGRIGYNHGSWIGRTTISKFNYLYQTFWVRS